MCCGDNELSGVERDRAMRKAGKQVDDLHDLMTRFINGKLGPEEWTHENHLRLGLYLAWLYDQQAFHIFRTGVERTNNALGHGDRFHYTITFAYLTIFRHVVKLRPEVPIIEMIDEVLTTAIADRGLMFRWYSSDVLLSERAKHGQYVPPDKGPKVIDETVVQTLLNAAILDPVGV